MRDRGRGLLVCGVVAVALGACLTVGTSDAVEPPPLPPVPGQQTSNGDVTPVGVPPAKPVSPEVEREQLTAPSPSPDARGARQATSADPLKLVAVTWTGASPRTVEVRSRLASGAFGPWTRADLLSAERESRPDSVSGTEPVWVDDSREVQVRATETNGAPATQRMSLTSIDPRTSSNDDRIARAAPAAPAPAPGLPSVPRFRSSAPSSVPSASVPAASSAGPKIVTRAQWGADEKLMTWAPEYTPTVRAVSIHHTAGSNDYTAADSAAIVRGIYAYHAKTLGWGDIGYHALVDRFGTIFEGRAGGLERSIIAAHSAGFNKETFGVAVMGDLTSVVPTSASMDGVARIAGWKLGGLYRDPKGTVTLTSTGVGTSKYAAGRAVTLPTVFAHRDVGRTECPGNTGYRSMDAIRNRIAGVVGSPSANPVRTKWLALRSTLGEPSVVESDAANGGRVTVFQGSAVYWTAATKAWALRGAIYTHWSKLGAERSSYGYPTSDQYAVSGGTRQDFQKGSLFLPTGSSTVRRA